MIIASIGTSVIVVGLILAAAVGTYFFLRNNKKTKAKIDAAVDKVVK